MAYERGEEGAFAHGFVAAYAYPHCHDMSESSL